MKTLKNLLYVLMFVLIATLNIQGQTFENRLFKTNIDENTLSMPWYFVLESAQTKSSEGFTMTNFDGVNFTTFPATVHYNIQSITSATDTPSVTIKISVLTFDNNVIEVDAFTITGSAKTDTVLTGAVNLDLVRSDSVVVRGQTYLFTASSVTSLKKGFIEFIIPRNEFAR